MGSIHLERIVYSEARTNHKLHTVVPSSNRCEVSYKITKGFRAMQDANSYYVGGQATFERIVAITIKWWLSHYMAGS